MARRVRACLFVVMAGSVLLVSLTGPGIIWDRVDDVKRQLLSEAGTLALRVDLRGRKIHEGREENISKQDASPGNRPMSRQSAPQSRQWNTGPGAKTLTGTIHCKLGNWLFVYASLYGLAVRFNRTMVFDTDCLGMNFLNLTAVSPKIYVNDTAWGKSSKIGFNPGLRCDAKALEFIQNNAHAQHIATHGGLQCWDYFDKFRREIKHELRFSESLIAARDEFLASSARRVFGEATDTTQVLYIAVHIRRGGMLRLSGRGFEVVNATYLRHAVVYMEKVTKGSKMTLYVAASNGMDWAKENFVAPRPTVFTEKPAGLDLAILAGCNHTIMSIGSFGWWAAYFAGGITVYYKNFPKPGSPLDKRANVTEYYLPEWIGLT